MRTGNPWASGRGSPFIATASIASLPSIASAVGVPSVNPSTDRVTILVGSRPDARLLEEVLQGCADPPSVPHVPAADGVGDAGDRDIALDHGAGEQLLEVHADLPVDHPVHAKSPVLGHDGRNQQRGVHAVEPGVRCEERSESRDGEIDRRGRGRAARRRRETDLGSRGVRPEATREEVPGTPGDHGRDRAGGPDQEEAPPIDDSSTAVIRW